MIIFCFLSTTLALTIASSGKETESRSLRFFLDEQTQISNNDNWKENHILRLPNGEFSSCGYPVISRTLTLEGMKTEVHISVEQNAHETETENGIDSSSAVDHSLISIFRIRNSTVSLSSLCLNSDQPSSLIASVSSSSVTVSDSDIRSNGANSPFVMLVGKANGQSGDIGSSLHLSKCSHISSSLVSLVPLTEISHKLDQHMNARKPWETNENSQFVEEMRISASELAIRDSCLTFGTGPLIGFGYDKDNTELGGEQAVLPRKVSSSLMKSQIMNTTSNPSGLIVDEAETMELTQRVMSSCVCLSTNHLYGTACVDMNANVMGSLLSLNTSFSSCLTDTATHLGQHFVTQQYLTQSASFKLCTFKECSTLSYGAAIYLRDNGSLVVEECSFKACITTSSTSAGGALYFIASTGATFKANSSSFVGCSAGIGGGTLCHDGPSAIVLNCVFIDSTSKTTGGCISLHSWDALSTSSSITNCLFENCKTTHTSVSNPYSGGAIYAVQVISLQLNFLNFRGNTAGVKDGNDIMFALLNTLITSETMVGCTSTSASPRLRVYPDVGTDEHLPNPTTTASLVSCEATAIHSDAVEFTLKMSETITGTVLVLIDNSDGTRTPTDVQAPNIGRVLSFSFDNTDEGSCSVSLGESGLVQTPLSAYSIIRSSIVGSYITSSECVLDENEENALITVSGYGIPSGVLSVTLSDNTLLNFEFLPGQKVSEVLAVPLNVALPKLRYGGSYPIHRLRSKSQTNHPITVPFLIEIIVPNPSRLTTLKFPGYDSKLKKVSINLEGVNLEGTHKVTFSVNETSETITIDVLFSSSKGKLEGILFDTDTPTNVNMSYNTRYEIVEMKKDDVNVLCLGNLSFKTIVEPTRLVTMECAYDEAKKNALIRMTGQVLDTTKEYEIELNDSENSKKTIEITFNTTSSKWEGSAILYSLDESVELEYGKTYSVRGFKTKGSTSKYLYEDVTVMIENEPSRIEEVSRMLDGEKTRMIVSLSGRELKSGMGKIGVCRGTSKWTSDTEIISGSDEKWKATFLVGFSESSTVLEYGSTYTLCGLDGSAFFVNEGISFVVPHPPIVSSIISELNTSTHSSFRVVMSGSDLPASGSFSASFSDSLGTFDISLSELSEWRSDWIEVTKTSAFEFNKTYTLTSLIDSSSGTADHLLCSGVTMKTPLGPTLTGLGGVSLTGASLDCVSIVVRVARIVADTFEVSVFDVDDSSKVLIPLSVSFSSCDSPDGLMTHSVSWDSALQYGHRYEIASMSSSTMVVSIPSQLVFEIPELLSFDNISITTNSIHTFLRILLSGNGLIGKNEVTLTSGFSFTVTAQSNTSAISEELAIGWSDSLAFETSFTVKTAFSIDPPDAVIVLKNSLAFTTPPKQDPLSLFVDGRTGETSRFCGESSRPCSSVEVAWEIVSQIGVRTPTVGIVHSATLGSPIRISNGMVALLSSFGNVDPKLSIPLSACNQVESGMIVVSSSTLQIRDVEIMIDSLSPSFVLLSAQNSNLTLKEGSFVGPQLSPSSNDELSEEICEWTSGVLQLDNCITSISDTKLNHLSLGAVNVKNGSLKVETSSFHDNSPNIASFSSHRRNIHCSNGGHIEIGSLSGGDGVGDRMGWFSRSDCTLSGDGVDIKTAFFAPTLSTDESKTTFTKKSKQFEVEIIGAVLIPCGLFLEVFEKTKDKEDGNHIKFELNLDSTQSFTEKNIKFAILQADLKKLNPELEWRGRLEFGDGQKTVETILIQKSISERRSEATLNNMKWWLPVVIVVSIILLVVVMMVVCLRRRKNGKEAGPTTSLTEMEEQEENVEKIAVDVEDEHNLALIRTTREEQYQQESMKEVPGQGESTKKDGKDDEMKLEEIEAVVCDGEVKVEVVGKCETLFERLHGRNRKEVDAIVVCRALIKGLVTAGKDERLNGALLTLSPHTIIVDSSNRICIVTPSEVKGKVRTELGKEITGSVVEGEERWRAPEQGNGKIEVGMGSEKVSVFRLGLLLLEMWTGRIPFGETDGVNASRQLGMGILPPLEGMSSEMEEIVRRCLSVDFQDRPRLLEMDELIQSLSTKDDRKVERGEVKKKPNLTEMLGMHSLVS
ncbi:hypothetical protein BLNAU_1310 [Blattamonas nauphoetae]|uniref:Protein kinase domain-containing protein n=1 Tax=Blattamonas nauphoetae TaxID=2049346 RepID=A0ABQ9YJ37_9EUKA|nr:hypothetical protein BLNAU_1310 [Blattamonas nauphoetae]